jgi:hypothetical protein
MMNSYALVLIITLILTILSCLSERMYPFIKCYRKSCDNFSIFLIRYVHLFLFIYFASFFIFFNVASSDAYIYLTMALCMLTSWYILECCILTYYELRLYGKKLKKLPTTYHPTMYSLFSNYSDYVMTTLGLFMVINVSYIMYKNNKIPKLGKVLYSIIFLIFFVDSILKSRVNKKQLYPKDKEHILNKYF